MIFDTAKKLVEEQDIDFLRSERQRQRLLFHSKHFRHS